ncbi:MAG: 23S rRNA (guanosine(2251)-2'-O)-methyltransferase RlmB [Gammaproteobacteria bacterium]|jgi:23S rRNA (guanosine2251-2'-O)-methyltransferase|nr:23S rRNA (guanosine(2251)-2'-O)-methyltransferase RlmB [Gammaproteobacteria bacterium]
MSKSHYITGLRAVEQVLATDASDVRRIYAEYQTANPRVEAIIKAAQGHGIEIQPANRARLAQMSGEARHQGVIAEVQRSTTMDEAGLRSMVEQRLTAADSEPLLLLVLDGVQDPHNLGACMRTADAAGVDAIVVPRHGAAGLSPAVSKVAAGAAEQLPFATVGNLNRVLGWLADYGVRAIGTSDKADSSLYTADLSGSVVLVMGREHTGLSQSISSRCDTLVSLPMKGVVSSLNVSVATGVCLYEIARQRALRPA